MTEESYLQWLVRATPTSWWHDSADPDELKRGMANGATGATTNPVLAYTALRIYPQKWAALWQSLPQDLKREERGQALMQGVVSRVAEALLPVHARLEGKQGYACAQVNPAGAGDREQMWLMAQRFHAWAPNIAVKLPVTAAGLDVLEDCAAEGMTVTATVSFTLPQVIWVAERYRRGRARALKQSRRPGQCFAVIMIGRLDDYLRDVAKDRKAKVSEADIRQSGMAVVKRAYAIFQQRGYEAVLLVAALRGTYHMTELAGARLIMSIHPKIQDMLLQPGLPRETGIDAPVAPDVIQRLQTVPEFVRAYEPDGMSPEDFITYGVTQRTLSQFSESGWLPLESWRPA